MRVRYRELMAASMIQINPIKILSGQWEVVLHAML
jgi:hypothetical protein